MIAVVFPKPDEFTLADVPKPMAGPGQVVVRVKSTTICGTDVKMLRGQVPFVTFPHIPGHEWGGQVAEVGEGVRGVQAGDKVGVEAHVGCGRCPRCVEGLYNLCHNYGRTDLGHTHIGFTVPGGLAAFCAVPARAVHVLPDGLDFDHGAFSDTLGIVLWAFERAGGVRGGESVAIVGPGALGLLAVQTSRVLGASQVIAVGTEQDKHRLALALELGADLALNANSDSDPVEAVRAATGGQGVDLVMEFAGTAAAGRHALEMARRGGRVVLAGATSPGKQLEVDLSTIVRGHLDVYGSMANPRGVTRRANMLMQEGLVDIRPLITHHLPLAQFPRAWQIFCDREGDPIRVMLHP